LPPPVLVYGLPVRLEIPKINVDTTILYMGLTTTGNMAVPTNVVNVGWYKYGPMPGNTGSAVIAGHLDGLQGQPGVFANLDKLIAGDTLSVIDNKGQTASFVVQRTQTYAQNEQPSEVFSDSDGRAHLNLITCTGPWDSSQRRYLERLVVFTTKTT
jgi:sortase A